METFKVNAETLNALVTALGALTFATVRHLPANEQAGFAADLAKLATSAEMAGRMTEETLLLDLHRAAISARR